MTQPFSAVDAVKAAVTERLRREGFPGSWNSFRRPYQDDLHVLIKFYAARTSLSSDLRPGFRIETNVMRPGDEATLGRGIRTVLIRLIPEGWPWPDVFESPDDLTDERRATEFAEFVVAAILSQGPPLWEAVRWWDQRTVQGTVSLAHGGRLGTRGIDLAPLERAWARGTARRPPEHIITWLRKISSHRTPP